MLLALEGMSKIAEYQDGSVYISSGMFWWMFVLLIVILISR